MSENSRNEQTCGIIHAMEYMDKMRLLVDSHWNFHRTMNNIRGIVIHILSALLFPFVLIKIYGS